MSIDFDYQTDREAGIQHILQLFVHNPVLQLTDKERSDGESLIRELTEEYGPVVDSYPAWHPFVRHLRTPYELPFPGLDHSIKFVNAILSTPYRKEYAQETIRAVREISRTLPDADLTAELLDGVTFYSPDVFPVLIKCDWRCDNGRHDCIPTMCKRTEAQIPTHLALPAMLGWNLKRLENCEVGESWRTMVPEHLGAPASEDESFFVSRETAGAMREAWDLLNKYEVFGPMF